MKPAYRQANSKIRRARGGIGASERIHELASRLFPRRLSRVVLAGFVLGFLSGLPANAASPKPCVVMPAQEMAWGRLRLASFMKEHKEISDEALTLRVSRIGRAMVEVSDRPNGLFRFLVVEGEDLQAYSFPGGTIVFTEPLVRLFSTDDELAFALAHELAHSALRHDAARLCIEEAMVEAGASEEEALRQTLKIALDLNTEMEADRFGALYSVRRGYKFTATYAALDSVGARIHGASGNEEIRQRVAALRGFRAELERAIEVFDNGLVALRRADAGEAISLFTLFVSEFPNSVSGRVNLGASYLAKVRAESGPPEDLSEVLPILPDPGVAVRGTMSVADLNSAADNFRQALRLQESEWTAHAGLALVHARFGEYEDARTDLRAAREAEPERRDFALCLGNVEYLDGNYPGAAALYRQSLDLSPGWPEAMRNLAFAEEKMGKQAEVCSLWEQVEQSRRFASEARRRLEDLCPSRSPD